jgi:molecular chaperone HtpG
VASTDASRDLVDELVHQFTDPYAAYRELIQNSIDAGSTRIEVTLAFRPEVKGGVMTATVQDWGEGMNRRTIEDYLLTKFRSSKENDLTKIGKYGIGFVSVFALQPDAVTVDTSRDGESWRVLFKSDRTYELLERREPFEGTQVTLHRRTTAAAYDEHVTRARQALQRWCRHSEVEVTFSAGGADGTAPGAPVTLHEPLRADAPFQVEHQEDGLWVVVGPAREEPPLSGFYNRGLTLLETHEVFIPGVSLKVVSRSLEHTLTRDNVRRDEHFARALSVARKLVSGPLLKELPRALEQAAGQERGTEDWRALFRFASTRLPMKALWLRAPGGGALKAGADKELYVSPSATALARRLVQAGVPVVEADPAEPFTLILRQALGALSVKVADASFSYAEPPTTAQPEGFAAALAELLEVADCPVEAVALAEVRGAGAAHAWSFIEVVGRPVTAAAATAALKRKRRSRVLCLNTTHPTVEKATALMHRAPRLSALLWARLLLVRHGLLDAKTDAVLTGWALA